MDETNYSLEKNIMAGNFQAKPVPQTALNARKMKLSAPNAAGKFAGMTLRLHNNNFRMQVYTNDPNDPKQGAITAAMSPVAFSVFLEMVKEAYMSEGKYQNTINNLGFKFNNGQRGSAPEVLSRTHVFKGDDGVIYISIVEHGRPNVKFPLINDQWHSFLDAEGNAMDKGAASKLYAAGWYSLWSKLAAHAMIAYFSEEEQKQGGNGGGQGGGGGKSWGNGGGNKSWGASSGGSAGGNAGVGDDEIPW